MKNEKLKQFGSELVEHVLDCNSSHFTLFHSFSKGRVEATCTCGTEIVVESYNLSPEEYARLKESIDWLNKNRKEIMFRFPRTRDMLDPIQSLEL